MDWTQDRSGRAVALVPPPPVDCFLPLSPGFSLSLKSIKESVFLCVCSYFSFLLFFSLSLIQAFI